MRVVSLKINSNVYPLKNTNSHYLLLNTTIIPLYNGKISLIFIVREIMNLYIKVPMPAHVFSSSDWLILKILLT